MPPSQFVRSDLTFCKTLFTLNPIRSLQKLRKPCEHTLFLQALAAKFLASMRF